MKNAIALTLVTTAFISGAAFADAGLDLAKEKQCLTCHAVDKASLAPSFQDIAKKYKKRGSVVEGALINQILSGTAASTGGYHWGTMPMPSQGARPNINVAEANAMLDWILKQK